MSDMYPPTDLPKDVNAEHLRTSGPPATAGLAGASEHLLEKNNGFTALRLSVEMLAAPAFFVDPDLHVRWIASDGSDSFSRILAEQHKSSPTGTIFNLLTRPVVKTAIDTWQDFFAFVYNVLKHSTDSAVFTAATGAVEEKPAAVSQTDGDPFGVENGFSIRSATVSFEGAASTPMRVFALGFPTGTLFLIRADGAPAPRLQEGMTALPEEVTGPAGISAIWQLPVGALTVHISNAQRLAEAMLPGAFFDLAKWIWNAADDSARSLGGKRVGINGGQIHYRFFESAGRNPIFSAITCAIRLTRHMMMIQEKSDVVRGWPEKIALQMGISCGHEDTTVFNGPDGMPPIIPGDAVDQASTLAALAGKKEIWITKTAVAYLPKPLMEQLTMGVERQGFFFQNGFARVSELPWSSVGSSVKPLQSDLTVTRIIDIKPSTPEPPDREKPIPCQIAVR